jgi:8-oxo-dGTP pyrophosphatase MutT (NUDIX family)
MRWGFPIVTATNVYEVLQTLGIQQKLVTNIQPLETLNPEELLPNQRKQLAYAPKIEVVTLDGGSDLWCRTRAKNWACTFILLRAPEESYVLLTGEFKHGFEQVSLTPPAGIPEKGESMADCALRETQQETGVQLTSVTPLSSPNGLGLSGRKSTERFFPFLGTPAYGPNDEPIITSMHLDSNEQLQPVLMPLAEYWIFLANSYDNEAGGRDTGYAALRELGLLTFTG